LNLVVHEQQNRFPLCWPWWRWVLTALSALGLAVSGYLGWHYLAGGSVIGCGGGSPCDDVLNSRWSSIGGVVPVSGLAAGTYLAMLAASLFIGPATEASVRRLAWRAMLVLVGAAAGSAVWFIIVQKWVLGSFCPYCMATHVTSLLLAALVIWQATRQDTADSNCGVRKAECGVRSPIWQRGSASARHSPTAPRRMIGASSAIGMASAGLALAGVLAACQAEIAPPALYRAGESRNNLPTIDPRHAPLIGTWRAPYIIELLFDYNCPHCQQLHFMLHEAVHRYRGKLAFALCPSPLNSRCNPYVPLDVDEFKTSCELAKIALAVWLAKREAFPLFDNWMYSFESGDHWRPRSLVAAKAKAVELVGGAPFDAALADPWVSRYLRTCVRIYGETVQGASNSQRANAVPKMIFGSRWVIPEPNNADDLVSILRDRLGVPKP
jgi:uncharacterized membrane protein